MGLLHWLDHWLASLERALVVLLLSGLLGLGLLQVIERNVLASGLFWADELLQHLVLWLGFLGASLATREQRHLSIDVLSHFLPTRWQLWLGLLINTVALVLCLLLVQAAWGVGAFRVHGWHHVDLWGSRLAGAKHHTAGVWGDHPAFCLASGADTCPIGPARGRGMILLGLLLVLLAILGTPLFAVFGALAWFLFRAAGIDTSAIMIELYRLASAPNPLAYSSVYLRGLCAGCQPGAAASGTLHAGPDRLAPRWSGADGTLRLRLFHCLYRCLGRDHRRARRLSPSRAAEGALSRAV